jgi:hypothetical protein
MHLVSQPPYSESQNSLMPLRPKFTASVVASRNHRWHDKHEDLFDKAMKPLHDDICPSLSLCSAPTDLRELGRLL